MSDAQPPLDRASLFAALHFNDVRFVLVGGLAAQAHGASRATGDADICPQWGTENLTRLAAALTDLGARLKIGEASIETLAMEIDARTIQAIEIGAWRTSAGDVDVLLGIPVSSRWQLARYERLAENAIELEIDEMSILVASLDDIIRSKETADRDKDRARLRSCASFSDEQAAGSSSACGIAARTSQIALDMSGHLARS